MLACKGKDITKAGHQGPHMHVAERPPVHRALATFNASSAMSGRPAAPRACMLRCAAEHSAPSIALQPRSSAHCEAVQWCR